MSCRQTLFAYCSVAAIAGALASTAGAQTNWSSALGYRLTVFGRDSGGLTVLQSGTVFVLKVPGVLGVPQDRSLVCAATFQDGVLHRPSAFCSGMVKEVSVFFQPGLKVYLSKIDANAKRDRITLHLVACDLCNGTEPVSYYKTEVAFQYAKGQLPTLRASDFTTDIAKVLEVDPSGGSPAAPAVAAVNRPPQPVQAPHAPQPFPSAPPPAVETAPPPVAPPPPPPPEPQTISVGQPVADVVTILGTPQRVVKISADKEIYMYKDLKVTFVNQKVANVE